MVRRVLSHAIGWVILCLTANNTEPVAATRIEKLPSDVNCSPSPGGEGRGEGGRKHQPHSNRRATGESYFSACKASQVSV